MGFVNNENNIVNSPHGLQNFITNRTAFIDIVSSGPQSSWGDWQLERRKVGSKQVT